MSLPLVRYILTAAIRDKLVLCLLLALAVSVSLSFLLGTSALVEKDKFAVVFSSGGLRLVGVMGLILFTVFFIRRSFDSRDVEFILSRPIGRIEFILSYSAGLSILAILLSIAQAAALCLTDPYLVGPSTLLWTASVIAENIIVVNTALFFSMVLSSATSAAMGVAGFYVLGRMMGQILGIIDTSAISHFMNLLEDIMQGISVIMPRLDLMGQGAWLIYPPSDDIGFGFIIIQACVFTMLVLLASMIDLVKRQF